MLVKVVNKHTGKEYHVIENEMDNDIINVYIMRAYGLLLEKSVGNKTFHEDYELIEKFEVTVG